MTIQSMPPSAASPARLAVQAGVALCLGTALTILVVLPAEYGVDLTGFGKLVGLTAISAPREIVVETEITAPPQIAKVEPTPFRQDVVTIEIGAFGESLAAVEYKVTLAAGETMIYSWKASQPVIFEFHGHTQPTDGSPVEVMNYVKGQGAESNGTLTAPIDGIHGWYFASSAFEPVTVELSMAGYYRLEPGVIGVH